MAVDKCAQVNEGQRTNPAVVIRALFSVFLRHSLSLA